MVNQAHGMENHGNQQSGCYCMKEKIIVQHSHPDCNHSYLSCYESGCNSMKDVKYCQLSWKCCFCVMLVQTLTRELSSNMSTTYQ